ncbi:Uncharacterized protein GBIM_07324 [Gryllus bimaculatus]|nr:Uncharacterized protein GBIM_07324 [Gryllus bimaculatus]
MGGKSIMNPTFPSEKISRAHGGTPYIISEQRLRKIRSEFLYCFFDGGGDDGEGDYQKNVHASTPQVHKNFNFQLPFFGFRFNYTRVSLNGYLEFSDPPEHYTYPLVFPNKDWPTKNDPSFIGIFFSKMRVGKMRPDDIDQRKAGVYFRLERDLQTRVDQFGVEMRERLMWDVREGVVGADTFEPKHATNTFQLVLATDEVYTYAIFNYVDIQWTSHTEAGGDTTIGEGGVPAYVGFNAGNGTRSYQYEPYSQASTLRDLTGRGWGNGFPGRHIFRIDERIMLGNCNKDIGQCAHRSHEQTKRAESISNQGMYTIHPANYRNRNNVGTNDIQFGFIHINLTNPEQYHGLTISPVLWSKPIPLAWYFGPQWERKYGTRWPVEMCNNWIKNDRFLKNFAAEIPQCPCILEHVLNDKGRYLSDWECDMDINPDCYYHQTAIHCMRTGAPSHEGLEQMCCYDKNGYLMLSYDQMWGSRPYRAHNLGFLPWNEATKVPTLSQWYHDIVPFYQCCMWQSEQAVGCETYRFERRPTQDCIAYQPPSIAAVFGDPHIVTFDNLEYTFNGKGEFVLVHADSNKAQLDVQARFEQVPRNIYGEVAATQLTAVATKDNISATIEIRVRPEHARWRYHLDVFADGRRVYFDRDSLKTQHFRGVIVYTPSYILNQSEVIVMFQSGAGVEVVENKGYLSCRVYLPWSFINQTRGLFGNWSFDMTDDFTLPNGYVVNIGNNLNNFERVHRDFALEWMLEDKDNEDIGKALFTRENMRASNYYGNRSFVPEYRKSIYEIVPTNRFVFLSFVNIL